MPKNQPTALATDLETVDCDLCGSGKKAPYLEAPDHNWPIQSNHLGAAAPSASWSLVQCQDCGLIYLNPRPTAAELAQHYPIDYYAYSSAPARPGSRLRRSLKLFLRRRRGLWSLLRHSPLRERFSDPLVETLGWIDVGAILDVGCGSGGFLDQLAPHGWRTYGVDISREGIEEARRHGHQTWLGDLTALDLPHSLVDVVRMSHVLEHTPSPRRTLTAVREVLRPGGLLLVEVPDAGSIWTPVFREHSWLWDLPRHFYHFTTTTLTRLAKETGFEIRELRRRSTPRYILQSMAVSLLHAENAPAMTEPIDPATLLKDPHLLESLEPFCRQLEKLGQGNSLLLIAACVK
jgi:SAM-dependent methyltransferase